MTCSGKPGGGCLSMNCERSCSTYSNTNVRIHSRLPNCVENVGNTS